MKEVFNKKVVEGERIGRVMLGSSDDRRRPRRLPRCDDSPDEMDSSSQTLGGFLAW